MSRVDIQTLLAPLSEDAPCGENLEYDPEYVQLEQTNQVTPEQQYGDTVVPAQDPDWNEVRRLALSLLERTRDLGAAVALTQAETALRGVHGLADGLKLIEGYHRNFWEAFHPQLDPDDDHDPTMRSNILVRLAQPDPMLRVLREAPLVTSRVGRFSWKHVMIARGELTPNGEGDPPSLTLIEGALAEQGPETAQELLAAATEARDALRGIEAVMTDRCGAAAAPNVSRLREMLGAMVDFVAEQVARLTGADVPVETAEGSAAADAAPGGPATPALAGEVRSREDVAKAIDKILAYYRKEEPGHPIPLLLMRVRYLIDKDFLQIIEDLAPDQVETLRSLGGLAATAQDTDQASE